MQLKDSNGDVVAVFKSGVSPRSVANGNSPTPGVLQITSNALSILDEVVVTHVYTSRRTGGYDGPDGTGWDTAFVG